MSALNNKYLKLLPGVKLTPIIEPVIIACDTFFADCPSFVTSGFRDAYDQLRVVNKYLVSKKIAHLYPLLATCKPSDTYFDVKLNKTIYVWQYAWSHLLALGVIINPPLDAICLMDYIGKDKVNRKGKLIHQTPHARMTAFNIGGGANGPADEAARMEKAIQAKIPGLVSYLLERENNAVHVNCKKV